MKISLCIISLGLVLAGFASCDKKGTSKEHELYIAGESSGFPSSNFYMKNSELVYLHNSGNDINGSIFVDGSDIYFPTHSGYLKNGVPVNLPGAYISSVYVKDGSVYAAGQRNPYGASYWKNGQLIKLEPDSSDYTVSVASIIVVGSDVYVGGTMYTTGSPFKVVYWKNNVLNIVGEGNFQGMAVSGNDVYVGGLINGSGGYAGVYWKNGTRHDLVTSEGYKPHSITSVFAQGNDVYITGGAGTTLYWKNGQPVGGFGNEGYPASVVVDNGNVYVLENFVLFPGSGPVSTILLWKNDKADTLFRGYGRSMCLGAPILAE